jgi:hypothetical protein
MEASDRVASGGPMSHAEFAPQSGRSANEPPVQRPRAEIIDRYRRLRAVSTGHNRAALKRLSTEALMEQARRLGLARGRTLLLGVEDELTFVFDLALYARHGERKRHIDRYAASQRLQSDSDEARVLDAMLAARFTLVRVERLHPEAGLIVSDLIREKELWLVDEGLESTAPLGSAMATCVYSPDDFHMTAGVLVPLEGALLRSALERRPLLMRMGLDEAVEDRRFAEAIYQEAIRAGVTERVRFEDPPGLAGAAA